jgi:hypothetical protein
LNPHSPAYETGDLPVVYTRSALVGNRTQGPRFGGAAPRSSGESSRHPCSELNGVGWLRRPATGSAGRGMKVWRRAAESNRAWSIFADRLDRRISASSSAASENRTRSSTLARWHAAKTSWPRCARRGTRTLTACLSECARRIRCARSPLESRAGYDPAKAGLKIQPPHQQKTRRNQPTLLRGSDSNEHPLA